MGGCGFKVHNTVDEVIELLCEDEMTRSKLGDSFFYSIHI